MNKNNIKTTDWLTRGVTEEQIAREKEEAIMAADLELCHNEAFIDDPMRIDYFDEISERMVEKGYHKQIEAEWITKSWETEDDWGCYNHRSIECSACKIEIYKGEPTEYCPHCGAEMRKGE